MGTTADKLARLNETKALLKTRLTEKGLDVASENNFYNLADKVGDIRGSNKATLTINSSSYTYVYVLSSDGEFVDVANKLYEPIEITVPSIIATYTRDYIFTPTSNGDISVLYYEKINAMYDSYFLTIGIFSATGDGSIDEQH